MMYGIYNTYGWGYHIVGGLMMIVFWALFISLIVWIVREISGKHSKHPHHHAIEILKERYAKSEISKEEFEEKKKDLS
ncbi:MAG: SHOCT domain-containing protein [Patescibacteria group bacterium]|nr:SHOCT domain-containing protein [Patescibacteria group bacterium]